MFVEKWIADQLKAERSNKKEPMNNQIVFIESWNAMQKAAHQNSKDKGFWEPSADALKVTALLNGIEIPPGIRAKVLEIVERMGTPSDCEKLVLMHQELSEALDAVRGGYPDDDKLPVFGNLEVELADTIIRIMDFAEKRGLNVAGAVVAKMAYNAGRAHKHGKAF